ncbi:MAG: hypothetical protein ABIP30_09460 [Ferruginibacter sp.]
MEQKEFSDFVIQKIIDRFPLFKGMCSTRLNDVIDLDYSSKKGKLILRLTTQNKEITIGFGVGSKFGWHTHMNIYGASTLDEEVDNAIQLTDSIINDKVKILYSSISGYFITPDIESVYENKEQGEIVETFYWGEV